MPATLIVYSGFLSIFLLFYALSARRILRGLEPPEVIVGENRPRVTVVVAARDEEGSIAACLRALAAQDYPEERFEVVVVDDGSSDRTAGIVGSFCSERANFKLIETGGERIGELSGKQSAVHRGISAAGGEIIALTDADCVPPATWLTAMVSGFAPGVSMVGGISLPDEGLEVGGFRRVQAYDQLFLQLVAAGFVNTGLPLSMIGNNAAFRKQAYESLGGYPELGFSLTEDTQLLAAVRDRNPGIITYNLDPDALVRSAAAGGWKDFFDQRLRWLAGGYRTGKAILRPLVTTFGLHLLILPLGIIWTLIYGLVPLSAALAALILKSALDGLIFRRGTGLIGRRTGFPGFIFFELFYICYTLLFGLLGLFRPRRVAWKGRVYP